MLNKEEILFAKLHDDVKLPTKRDEDGCFDIYAYFNEDYIVIAPHETKLISTGLISAFDKSYQVFLKERSSAGVKGIGLRAGVIDSGYRGEWKVAITNHNEKPLLITKEATDTAIEALEDDYVVYRYSKAICQAAVIPVPPVHVAEVPCDFIAYIGSERGAGGFGSSGK